jgi:hypothetical protein
MGCCTSTDKVLLSARLRPADTASITSSFDKLPLSRELASSTPPCWVSESFMSTLHRVVLLTLTLLASSCGISATSSVRLPSLKERVNTAAPEPPPAPQAADVLPLSSERRRLVASSQVLKRR